MLSLKALLGWALALTLGHLGNGCESRSALLLRLRATDVPLHVIRRLEVWQADDRAWSDDQVRLPDSSLF